MSPGPRRLALALALAGVAPLGCSEAAPGAPEVCADCAPDAAADPGPAPAACPPGVSQSFCPSPTSLVVCDEAGLQWVERFCDGGEYCLDGRCTAAACAPGQIICSDPKTRAACLSDGAGGYAWTPIGRCDGLCRQGLCVDACGFDPKRASVDPCEHFVIELQGAPDSACAAHDLLAVPSSGDDRVAVYDTSQDPPALLPGSPFQTCANPSRILIDRATDVVVTCRDDGRVHKHRSDGAVLWETQLPGCSAVRGAAVGPADRLFVGCTSSRNVHELDPATGEVLDTVQTGVDIYGLAVDGTGLYALDFGNLVKIGVAGALHVIWLVPADGYGIATDGLGRVWLSESPGLVAYSAEDGRVLQVVGVQGPEPAVGGYCQGVTVALDGRVYTGCAESGDFAAVYDPAGDALEIVAMPPGVEHPRGVAADRHGNLYTINRHSQDVTRFDAVTGAPKTFGGGALDQPYGYSGDMTGLTACLYAGTTRWTGPALDLGAPVRWLRIEWRATAPPGTAIAVFYRLDGGPWVQVLSGMPIDAVAQVLEVEAILESSDPEAAPTLHELAVFHEAP